MNLEFFWLRVSNVFISSVDCQCSLLSSLLSPKGMSTKIMSEVMFQTEQRVWGGKNILCMPPHGSLPVRMPSNSWHVPTQTCSMSLPFLLTFYDNILELSQLPGILQHQSSWQPSHFPIHPQSLCLSAASWHGGGQGGCCLSFLPSFGLILEVVLLFVPLAVCLLPSRVFLAFYFETVIYPQKMAKPVQRGFMILSQCLCVPWWLRMTWALCT